MKKLIDWILGLFKKPEEEFEPIEFKVWPFPEEAPKPKRKPRVAKATTRPKKTVAKKATTVAKKTTKKAK